MEPLYVFSVCFSPLAPVESNTVHRNPAGRNQFHSFMLCGYTHLLISIEEQSGSWLDGAFGMKRAGAGEGQARGPEREHLRWSQ